MRPQLQQMRTIFGYPLVWLIIGFVGVGAVAVFTSGGGLSTVSDVVFPVVGAVVATVIYWAVMRFVAGRATPELTLIGKDLVLGAGIGIGYVLVSVGLIALAGGYAFGVVSSPQIGAISSGLAVAFGAAVTEELLLRGLALQAFERLWGSGVALTITAVAFGALHLANPSATVWSSCAIAVQAGVVLGAAFLWRRNIWFVVTLHFAWNATLALLGIPVSGQLTTGMLVTIDNGPELLSGGDFGIEASIVPVGLGIALSVAMLVLARRRRSRLTAAAPGTS